MIDLHYWTTPNGHKITMFLEEAGLPYKIFPVRIGAGEQFKPDFLKISPNNRIPAPIVDKLNAGMNAVLRQPDIAARLKQLNVESRENTPEEFRAFVAAEMEKWGRVVREANIRLG